MNTPSRRYSIAVIAGDGIGLEVVPAALSSLRVVAARHDFELAVTEYPWGSAYFHAHGSMMPADGLDQLAGHEAIFLGAVGDPAIPDTETLWGLLIPIRRTFDQYINLRPVRTLPGVPARVLDAGELDLVIVRENVEGEYSTVGGRIYTGQPHETAVQEAIFTRRGVARAAEFAARLASSRTGRLTSATKSNGIIHTMPFWDEVVAETMAGHPDVTLDKVLIDALAAKLVLAPGSFDVIVASNLFGDILSDLAAAIAGSIGVAPSGNLNPERAHPSMFEPVHGSAPDIAGLGVANPIGQIWAGAMMLDHLGETAAAAELVGAFESCLVDGVRTRDLGGTAGTEEFTAAVNSRLAALP
ncbi:MAG TPA: tartrate dehydrogenase [Pseudonocardiaceae bacterium]|jgi:tartrate dehydrogenase/decarboxylase/D-malate dehydrogenase|nr:tartrate dehydrogenase [Pseudonocardiaceae bacterium]